MYGLQIDVVEIDSVRNINLSHNFHWVFAIITTTLPA